MDPITIWECDQGSEEWYVLRLGIPTASEMHRVMTPAKRDYAAAAEKYACELAVERLLRESKTPVQGVPAMERGKVLEPDAVKHFEFLYGPTTKVGFISDRDLTWGCSPDRILVEEVGGLELKCPDADTHVAYSMSDDPGKDYKCQLQGSMMITGFPHWDFMSYHPGLPEVVFRYERDEKFIADLRKCVRRLQERVDEICDVLRTKGEIGYAGRKPKTLEEMNITSRVLKSAGAE